MRMCILKINHNQLLENSERQGSRLVSSVAGADHFSQTDRKKLRGLLLLLLNGLISIMLIFPI